MAESGLTQPPAWGVISGDDHRSRDRRSSTRSCSARSPAGAPPRTPTAGRCWPASATPGCSGATASSSTSCASRCSSTRSDCCRTPRGPGRLRGAPAASSSSGPRTVSSRSCTPATARSTRRSGCAGPRAEAVPRAQRRGRDGELERASELRPRDRSPAGRDDRLDHAARAAATATRSSATPSWWRPTWRALHQRRAGRDGLRRRARCSGPARRPAHAGTSDPTEHRRASMEPSAHTRRHIQRRKGSQR